MKVTSIDLYSANSSNYANLSFRDPTSQNPYQAKAIIGLDADEITPRYYGYSGTTGDKFYSLSLQKRTIIMRIGLNPRYGNFETASDLRDNLYRVISSARKGLIELRFNNGLDTVAAITGFVSKFEAPHFSKTSEVQITVVCDDAMLRALEPISVDVSGLSPTSTTINDTLSTAPHGFNFKVSFPAPTASWLITDITFQWGFTVTPFGGFLTNDVLNLSSEHTGKEVYLQRGATIIPLADVVTPGSIWPVLFPGENFIVCSAGANWVTISYYPTYWGV